MSRTTPGRDEVLSYFEDRNWGRWGQDDEKGAINLITPAKRVQAAQLVRSGRAVTLSRTFPTQPHVGNPTPAQHFMKTMPGIDGSAAVVDYYGISYHGYVTTHIDALGHIFIGGEMWQGRDVDEVVTLDGLRFGDIDQWSEGIATRGVLLDVPAYRGEPCVTVDNPVHGWELEAIERGSGLSIEPGDAVFVYCGREVWEERHGPIHRDLPERPGLHASCMPFVRRRDIAVLGWDMMDAAPNEYGVNWSMHGVVQAYGVALVDNAALDALAAACAEESRHEFMVTINPLRVPGGTGSPVNPIALF